MDLDYAVFPFVIVCVALLTVGIAVQRLRGLPERRYSKRRKVSELILLPFLLVLTVGIAGSSAWNALAIHSFWAAHPATGEFFNVEGRRMYLYCLGNGEPTLVLDSGLGNDSLIWSGLQPELAKTTRVCSYDRAGFGWSESASTPRDADHIAGELHELLMSAGVTGPVVLMGHSIAGLYIRDYAARFPTQGLIFLDSSTPWQEKNPVVKAADPGLPQGLLRVAFVIGAPRWIGVCSGDTNGPAVLMRKLQAEDLCRTRMASVNREVNSFDESSAEVMRNESVGDIPILVVSHDPAKMIASGPKMAQSREQQAVWSEMQENLKKLSPRSRRIIARNSTHYIQLDRPDLLERVIPAFIDQLRRRPNAEDASKTVIE